MKLNEPVYGVLKSQKKVKLIRLLLRENGIPEMSEREMAKLLKISNVSVNRTMNELQSLNMVHAKFVGGAKVWSTNKKSHAYAVLKKVLNPKEGDILPIEGLKKMMIKELKKLPVIEAVLFGSVARAEEKPGSDIDLFLLVKGNTEKNIVEKAVRNLDDRIRELYGNGLGEYILTEKEYAQKAGLGVIRNIKKEGIKLI